MISSDWEPLWQFSCDRFLAMYVPGWRNGDTHFLIALPSRAGRKSPILCNMTDLPSDQTIRR